jgi:hydroxypyruvate isomerase
VLMQLGAHPLAANLSLMFTEVPFLERFAAARAAGFRHVELWWPFATYKPTTKIVDSVIAAVEAAGVHLIAMNLFAGDMAAGERGVLSLPDGSGQFLESLAVTARVAAETGCAAYNALYGLRSPDLSPQLQDSTAEANLIAAVHILAPYGHVLLEALTADAQNRYPLTSCSAVSEVIARTTTSVGSPRLLFDVFHLTNNGEDLISAIDRFSPLIGHVQFADSPGRHEPGTGAIDFYAVMKALSLCEYGGAIAAEYISVAGTVAGLDWVATLDASRM